MSFKKIAYDKYDALGYEQVNAMQDAIVNMEKDLGNQAELLKQIQNIRSTLTTLENTLSKHASQHKKGGKDPLTPAMIGAANASHSHDIANITGLSEQLQSYGKIVTGSYVGNSRYGENNPTSLTFDGVPKFVVIYCSYEEEYDTLGNTRTIAYYSLWCHGSDALVRPSFDEKSSAALATVSGNTLSWYNDYDSDYQCNRGGVTHHYFAIVE